MKIMMMVVIAMLMIKSSVLEKRKRKIKWAQGKGIFDRAILFCHSRHLVGSK